MTEATKTALTEAERSTLRRIAEGKRTAFKMRGGLTLEQQDEYRIVDALFRRGFINPVARLDRGKTAFASTPKGDAYLIGTA
jgi:hypothetical protein